MHSTIAWKDRAWIPISDAHLAVDDWGVVQGVMIVDRLRTCNQRPLDLQKHFTRLEDNCRAIGIPAGHLQQLPEIIEQCVEKNLTFFPGQDFGLVVLVTPGIVGSSLNPTTIVHAQPLNWSTMASWYEQGQELIVAAARNVPTACWSPAIKTRSRLHYYLADREAHAIREEAGAVLLNTAGFITETSTASIIVIDEAGRVCAPPVADVLGSVSLERTLRLAANMNLTILRQPIPPELIATAREILLAGTSACLWPAAAVGDRRFDNAAQLPVYTLLRDRWIEDIGLDYCAQSRRFRNGI